MPALGCMTQHKNYCRTEREVEIGPAFGLGVSPTLLGSANQTTSVSRLVVCGIAM